MSSYQVPPTVLHTRDLGELRVFKCKGKVVREKWA